MRPFQLFLAVWLSAVTVCALTFPIAPVITEWYQYPVIPGLEEKARILFFHVPLAWTSVVGFIVSVVFAIRYLRGKRIDDDIRSASAAGLGMLFCVLTTVTGAIWAKFSWGSFWNWDPRETSIFVLLLIYGAYFALRSSIHEDEKRATLAAVYAIIAGVTMPFLMFVMPRIIASLHPDPIINTRGKVSMNGTMLTVFFSSLGGFTALFFWIYSLKVRLARLEFKRSTEGA
jgi:heme exporter protein C